jgi:transcriptional regulator with XRE-family HTH domain
MKDRLAELIGELGVLKKDFAQEIDVSTGNLSDWLAGKTEPSAKALARIYEKYKVNLNWLVAGAGTMFQEGHIVAEERAAYGKKAKPPDESVSQLQQRLDQLEKDVRELREKK